MKLKDLNQRLIFLLPPGEKDADGFPVQDWTPYTTVWANLRTLKGRTFYAAAQNNLENSREFTIRFRKDLHDRMRVKWNDVVHELVAPIENVDGLNREMKVIVKAVTP